MMPIGHGKESDSVSNFEVSEKIKEKYIVSADNKRHGNGPAKYIKLETGVQNIYQRNTR